MRPPPDGERPRPGRPARGEIVTSSGSKPGKLPNDGVDIALPEGTPIRAVHEGTVAPRQLQFELRKKGAPVDPLRYLGG